MSAAREEEEEEEPASLLLRLEPTASRLAAICRLDLRKAGLKRLPASIGLCATCLEQLDVGGNPLESLDGVQTLGRLRVLFATENGLAVLDGEALPPKLGWLICAQNAIAEVRAPHRLSHVRKLMLPHNLLDAVAADLLIEAIPALEMLRLACNRMETLPAAAFRHPRLAWFAFGGNPYSARLCAAALSAADAAADAVATLKDASEAGREVDQIERQSGEALSATAGQQAVAVGEEELGRGSGAVVKRGTWQGTPVACKLWSAELFSDGDARGEWLMGRLTGGCASLVRTLAAWETPSLGMAVVKLSDLGAACAYDRHGHTAVEKLEVRSFGLLLLDLLSHLQARPSFAELCAEL
ncbi:hypothetical protein EMIHUDRAFT_199859 [Emiliania huxleyi CCMP1516]|uniref:Protein kinase domain-containing protein n=2 Tax=Emiliania huxleyi TaxID=2903 RepID=A0A0D3KUI4_EMIH1|nr:hypothetical protein EMIHUDRAFT_199859 [Emiliania huxleyi CCMP1516]EOD39419.1 hypothetical protein EMIHUDRAFT_199859 [Emiliania huxleyi CCMP1516]|eukprot:XP_005791848.1 hypothetical protein EMIHUDRAFT_199859 [Emiliania huxleyi CCMP1516]